MQGRDVTDLPAPRSLRLARLLCLTALVTVLVGCEDTSETAVRRRSPCADGTIVSLGNPNSQDRFAAFEVVRGPVWFGVRSWQPGILDPEPYRSVIELGPLDKPPVHDRNGNIPSRTERTLVVDDLWSRSELKPGSYWLLAGGPRAGVEVQTCGAARVRDITEASTSRRAGTPQGASLTP